MRTWCFEIDAENHPVEVNLDDALARWRAGEGPFWYHVAGPDPETVAGPLSKLGLPPELIQQFLESGNAARVLPLDGGLYFEFPSRLVGDQLKTDSFICLDRLVVTVRETTREDDPAAMNRTLLGLLAIKERTTSELVAALLAAESIELRQQTARLREDVTRLMSKLAADPETVEPDEILELKHRIVDQEAVSDERTAILEGLETIRNRSLTLGIRIDDFRVAVGNTAATTRRLDRLERRVSDLQTRYDLHQQDKTNRRLSRLTIISAIFLPLTLIAGVYGMNFDVMPELHLSFGYPLVLGMMALIAAGLIWWFRSRGWID